MFATMRNVSRIGRARVHRISQVGIGNPLQKRNIADAVAAATELKRYLATNNSKHPNVEINTYTNISDFPPKKINTVVNFGRQGTTYVIERFGKYVRTEKPGLFWTLPFIERIYAVDSRQIVIDVARQNAFTSDNVAVSVAAQLYLNVVDSNAACYKVQQPLVAVVSQAQSALRIAIGKNDLDHLLKDRNSINESVKQALHGSTEQWGVDVSRFEITELTPDRRIQEAMDLQSTAERERRALVTAAEGKRRAMELEAEGKKLSIELEAQAKKRAVELEAEGMLNAAKSLEHVTAPVLNYWLQNMHIKMVGTVASTGKHSSYFMSKDMAQLPVWTDSLIDKNSGNRNQ